MTVRGDGTPNTWRVRVFGASVGKDILLETPKEGEAREGMGRVGFDYLRARHANRGINDATATLLLEEARFRLTEDGLYALVGWREIERWKVSLEMKR